MNCCGRRATFHRQPPHSTPTFCAPDAEFISPPPHIVCLFLAERHWHIWQRSSVEVEIFRGVSQFVFGGVRGGQAGRRGRGNIYDDRRGPEPDGRGGTQGRGQTCAPPACRRRHAPASLSLSQLRKCQPEEEEEEERWTRGPQEAGARRGVSLSCHEGMIKRALPTLPPPAPLFLHPRDAQFFKITNCAEK